MIAGPRAASAQGGRRVGRTEKSGLTESGKVRAATALVTARRFHFLNTRRGFHCLSASVSDPLGSWQNRDPVPVVG